MPFSIRPSRAARDCLLALLAVFALAACRQQAPDTQGAASDARTPPKPAPAVVLEDVLETTPTHVVGISYPDGLERWPALAAQARRFADQARRELLDAASGRPADTAAGPYELSLEFTLRHESPQLVVLAVDGHTYTGGAHGMPVIERWVWLPPEDRMLTAAELFPQPDSWKAIADDVRTQLRGAVAQRLEADRVSGPERVEAMRSAGAMIDSGTEPGPENFAVFEPVIAPDGRIGALRFLFPPYQVGPYAAGMQTVELPAAAVLPYVNPAYRRLFETA